MRQRGCTQIRPSISRRGNTQFGPTNRWRSRPRKGKPTGRRGLARNESGSTQRESARKEEPRIDQDDEPRAGLCTERGRRSRRGCARVDVTFARRGRTQNTRRGVRRDSTRDGPGITRRGLARNEERGARWGTQGTCTVELCTKPAGKPAARLQQNDGKGVWRGNRREGGHESGPYKEGEET